MRVRTVLCAIAWALASTAALAQAPITTVRAQQVVRQDPSLKTGVLPNGLRYTVMRNATPKGGVSLRLAIEVGSYEEAAHERGAAHFLEHMAFNGTRSFPEGQLDRMFADLGVGFGRDQNAATSLHFTRFDLDLPRAEPAAMDIAFRWLREVADGVVFSEAAVARERGVILAEREARMSPGEETQQAVMRFQLAGARSIDREPIGVLESLRAMDEKTLRGFYERWYRPDNAMVVVVGDLPEEELERRIVEAFSSWKAAGPLPARTQPIMAKVDRGEEMLIRSDRNAAQGASLCRTRLPDPPRTVYDLEALRSETVGHLWRSILDKRLEQLASADEPPFASAAVFFSDDTRDAASTCLIFIPLQTRVEAGLAAAQTELRRFEQHGPTELELETAIEELRSRYRASANSMATRDSRMLASALVEIDVQDMVLMHPLEAFRAYDMAVEDLTGADLVAAFRKDWAGAGPLLSVVSPSPPQEAALASAWQAIKAAPAPEAYKDTKLAAWGYSSFGVPGQPVKREPIALGDFVRFTFANGVVFNFKRTEFEQEQVAVAVSFGQGRREFADSEFYSALMASAMLKDGGLKRHALSEVEALFRTSSWDASLDVRDHSYSLSGRTTPSALAGQLQILAAYLTEPGFRKNVDAVLPTTVDAMYRVYRTEPNMVMNEALAKAVTGRGRVPPREELVKLNSTDFQRLLTPALTESPLEVTVVGDITEALALRLVSQTFGALPPRGRALPQAKDQTFLRFPDRPLGVVRVTHEGSPERAVAGVVWPTYVADPKRRREEYAITLVAELLNDALRRRIREELGKSYAPVASSTMPDFADQGYVMAVVEAYPADTQLVVDETIKVAQALAGGQITAEQVESARRPLLTGFIAQGQTNDWWISAIDGSSVNDQGIRDILEIGQIIGDLTLDEVKKAAADWLSKPPIVVIAEPVAARTAAVDGASGRP